MKTLKHIFKQAVYKITGKCLHDKRKEGITMDNGEYKIKERCQICMEVG